MHVPEYAKSAVSVYVNGSLYSVVICPVECSDHGNMLCRLVDNCSKWIG